MTETYLPGWDAEGQNVSKVPSGLGVPGLYVTGSDGVPATAEQLATYPEAIRIDQSPAITAADTTADMFDVEQYAVTFADVPTLYRNALADYEKGTRPGQRLPSFYVSQDNVTPLANTFVAAGITSGPKLVVATRGLPMATVLAMLASSGGPFPIVGVQYADNGAYDSDYWLASYIYTRSVAPKVPEPSADPPPNPTKTIVSVVVTFSDGSKQTVA